MVYILVIGSNLPQNGIRKGVNADLQQGWARPAVLQKTENPIAITQTTAGRTCPGSVRLPAPETLRPCGHSNFIRQVAMDDGNLDWLMNWYVRECNNDWEHSYGVKIDTLDNPGWTIEIDLRQTFLEGRPFESKHGEPADALDEWRELGSWWTADADGIRFKAACGPTDLSSVIGVFREWVESHKN